MQVRNVVSRCVVVLSVDGWSELWLALATCGPS